MQRSPATQLNVRHCETACESCSFHATIAELPWISILGVLNWVQSGICYWEGNSAEGQLN